MYNSYLESTLTHCLSSQCLVSVYYYCLSGLWGFLILWLVCVYTIDMFFMYSCTCVQTWPIQCCFQCSAFLLLYLKVWLDKLPRPSVINTVCIRKNNMSSSNMQEIKARGIVELLYEVTPKLVLNDWTFV